MPTTTATRLTKSEQHELCIKHESMCWWVAKRLAPRAVGDKLEELVAEIRYHMVRAATLFDPSRGLKFSTFAFGIATRYQARFFFNRELRGGFHLPQNRELTETVPHAVSLNHIIGRSGDGSLSELVATDDTSTDVEMSKTEMWDLIRPVLPKRSFDVLYEYYTTGVTLAVMARKFNLSRERVRQIMDNAKYRILQKLPQLADFMDGGC